MNEVTRKCYYITREPFGGEHAYPIELPALLGTPADIGNQKQERTPDK
jgi:hypothetical protein